MDFNRIAPEFRELTAAYGVNVPGLVEAIWQPQYDTLAYAAAGQTQLVFFQNPVGQNSKTLADTNMQAAGQIPAPQQFLATGIGLEFLPNSAITIGTTTAADFVKYVNDVQAFARGGALTFTVGNKVQYTDAPCGKFPPPNRLDVSAAAAGSIGTSGLTIGYAQTQGMFCDITPVNIPWAQNFNVTLSWPTAIPLPSSAAGTVRCTLLGYLYRSAQ